VLYFVHTISYAIIMQTFLPYRDFTKTAKALDYRRLGKQRVEARQILDIISNNKTGAWSNHPAVNMWRGYSEALSEYSDCIISEWIKRGYRNNMEINGIIAFTYPPWLGDENFHLSHRSNLLRKAPDSYSKIWPDVPDNLPYVWPVTKKVVVSAI
jgi:hypothetical protein